MLILVVCISVALAKRKPPPKMEPLKVQGVTYSVEWTRNQTHQTACVVGQSDGKEVVRQRLYHLEYNRRLQTDVQDVYIQKMWREGPMLKMRDQKGGIYKVQLPNIHQL